MDKTIQDSPKIATSTLELLEKTLEHMMETAIARYKAGDRVVSSKSGRVFFSRRNIAAEMAKIALPEEANLVRGQSTFARYNELNKLIVNTQEEFSNNYPKIRTKSKKARELIIYLESNIEHTDYLRRSATELVKDDFYLNHLIKFFEIIDNEATPMGDIVEKLLGKKISNNSLYALLFIASRIYPTILRKYLKLQIKECYKDEYLYRGLELDKYLGFKQGKTKVSQLLYSKTERLKLVNEMIKEEIKDYWEEENGLYKAHTKLGEVFIRYLNKQAVLTYSLVNTNNPYLSQMIKNDFKFLRRMVLDITESKKSIQQVAYEYNVCNKFLFDIYAAFNPKELLNELKIAYKQLIRSNKLVKNSGQAIEAAFHFCKPKRSQKSRWVKKADTKIYDEITLLTKNMIKLQLRVFQKINYHMLKSRPSQLVLIYPTGKALSSCSYEISFANFPLFLEWSEFINSLEAKQRKDLHLQNFFNHLVKKYPNKKILRAIDITKEDLHEYLLTINKHSAKSTIIEYRSFYKYIKELRNKRKLPTMGMLPMPPEKDITKNMRVVIDRNMNNYQPLPDIIYSRISLHLDEIETSVRNAFILTSIAGLRPNEWEGITPKSLITENGTKYLIVWQFKQEKAYRIRGKKPIRKVPITDPIAIGAFESQIVESKFARLQSGIDSIFTVKLNKSELDGRYGVLKAQRVNYVINQLIKKHGICGEDGKLWEYSSYQLRVSMVVEMIEAGATDKELQAFFGWLSEETIKTSYAMAKKLKLADLNSEFFRTEFGVELAQSVLNQYSEEELRMIYVELYVHSRDMGYGRCLRHPIQGECGKLHEASACAPCSKLNVDHTRRPAWEELYEMQYKKVVQLRHFYEERGQEPERYEAFAFYIKEMCILESYASVLINVDKPTKVVK